MGLETNLNTSPYYDDFDIEKNFHRILFKPAVAVQARELTQLQTILQNQIERFGTNVLKEGTIVSGGNFVEIPKFAYVKINDSDTDGNPVNVSLYEGKFAVGTVTGLRARIETVAVGFESQSPDLNTLYVKYLGTNDNDDKTFSSSENLEIQEENGTVIVTVTVAGTSDNAPIGEGYGVRSGDGIIFQKGHFVRFSDGIAIVSKYDTVPDDVLVGFRTEESIVNSNQDSSLLDNAIGFNNVNAPGADRLKLTPVLTVYTAAEAAEEETFFAIQEYRDGNVIRRNLTTVYNVLQNLIERRSVEENGNFVVNRFPLRVETDTANTDQNILVIGPGLAYVEGRRIESVGDERIEFSKAIDTATVNDQNIVANYGNYVRCTDLVGTFDINTFDSINLVDGASATIGTANIRSLLKTGANAYNAYLFNIRMSAGETFADVRTLETAGGASLTAVLDSANNAVQRDFSFKKAVYPIGKNAVQNLDLSDTSYIYRAANTTATMTTAGTITLNLPAGDTFPYTVSSSLNDLQKLDLIIVSAETQAPYTDGDVIDIADSAATVTVTSASQLTIQLDDANNFPAATMDVTVYHNANREVTTVNSKVLQTLYVKIDTATHPANTSGVYSLGVPDVYDIEGIYVGSTYDVNNTNYVSNFNLFTNSKDTHYDLSYIAARGAANNPLNPSDKILVKARVFRNTSGVNTFFSVDSYPIDDATTPLPANKIRTEQIPVYTTDSGQRINLRDAIDVRPYAANTAVYSTTIGSATENPTDTLDFGSTSQFFIGPNQAVETNFDYYLSRIDRLVLDYSGNFYILPGEAAENPKAPATPEKAISPALINIGPFPSIPTATASRQDRNEYSVFLTRIDNDNYYPDDIRKLENRVKLLEDYTSLTLLETQATDLVIQDANGLDRFKNGILVDAFEDFSVAKNSSEQFTASLDPTANELLPRFRAHGLDLKVVSTSGVTEYLQGALLNSTASAMIEQTFATTQRSCTTDFWKFNGQMVIVPEADTGVDLVNAPDVNTTSNEVSFSTSLAEQIPLLQPEVEGSELSNLLEEAQNQNSVTRNSAFRNVFTTANRSSATNSRRNGAFTTDIRFDSFMRSRDVQVIITGMRPNTRMYFYFDRQDIAAQTAPAVVVGTELRRAGNFGDAIRSDVNGVVLAIFRIPANTFYVGERKLEVFDVNQYSALDSASTYSSHMYNAFNLGSGSRGVQTPAPRPPVITPPAQTTARADVDRGGGGGGGGDPISQTFAIDVNESLDSVVIVPSVDLYFARKSATNGVTVEIRETVNGYPSATPVAYGTKHLTSAEITANNITAAGKTVVTFNTPVILKTNEEYCVVIKPDANDPDYLVWISRVGELDVDSGLAIRQDTNAGTLFTSTNNKAWTPYQDENLKFAINKAEFTSLSGTISLTNKDNEFLKLANTNSETFIPGEYVFKDNANTYLTGTVSVVAGNTTIIGTGTAFTSEYEEGEHIVVNYPANTQVLEISSIANNTSMTLLDIPRFDATNVDHFVSVVGKASYYFNRDPLTLVLADSTAKTGFVFANSDIIVGEDSGAEATIIELEDLAVSYLQPNILKSDFSNTRTSLQASLNRAAGQYSRNLKFSDNNYLTTDETFIKSRSNEITDDSGTNSFVVTVNLQSTTADASPVVDFDASSIFAYEYFINNDSTGEGSNFGNAETVYLTNKVELADGLEAEDMRVFLTAYRPPSTDIEVFVKMVAASDPNEFEDCSCTTWTKLEKVAVNDVTSSSANRNDFKEFEYRLGETVLGNGGGAYLENGDTFKYTDKDGALYTNFKFFAVKIVLLSSTHKIVPRVKDMRAIALS